MPLKVGSPSAASSHKYYHSSFYRILIGSHTRLVDTYFEAEILLLFSTSLPKRGIQTSTNVTGNQLAPTTSASGLAPRTSTDTTGTLHKITVNRLKTSNSSCRTPALQVYRATRRTHRCHLDHLSLPSRPASSQPSQPRLRHTQPLHLLIQQLHHRTTHLPATALLPDNMAPHPSQPPRRHTLPTRQPLPP